MQKNKTFQLLKLPKHQKPLKIKYEFKVRDSEKLVKYKACLVVKGFRREAGSTLMGFFSVVKMSSNGATLGLITSMDNEFK